MSMRSLVAATAIVATVSAGALAGSPAKAPKLGTPMSAEDIASWNLTIFPDGRGLPKGKGNAAQGRAIYDKVCANCHGAEGRGGTAEELVSAPQSPTDEAASKAIGPYWPFATTLFDFIRRSMPPSAPGTLPADDLYAVTAYLLAANKVIAETDEMTETTLPNVKMPNRDGFDWIDVKK